MSTKKVLAAMSGGVDSSVAAALLKEEGYDLIGVTMVLACTSNSSDRGCCSASAAGDAKKVADQLGFPHYTLNFKDEFKRCVIDNFVEEYRSGRTPNPCIRCNQYLKFGLLLKKAKELGAAFVATGHYARILREFPISNFQFPNNNQNSKFKLIKGVDPKKDQSYVLYTMGQESLAQTLFPLGEWTKEKVREKAKELGLPVAEKAESQEICFVEDDDYGRFISKAIPQAAKPGPILDRKGNRIGTHQGIVFYTIGQRKGIGAHRGKPKYVVEIDRENNSIVIGDQEETFGNELMATDVAYVSGETPGGPLEIRAKIRYNSSEAEAVLYPGENTRVVFKKPQRAITHGQSVVFYRGEGILGGGIIRS